jgi:hypothetical protein
MCVYFVFSFQFWPLCVVLTSQFCKSFIRKSLFVVKGEVLTLLWLYLSWVWRFLNSHASCLFYWDAGCNQRHILHNFATLWCHCGMNSFIHYTVTNDHLWKIGFRRQINFSFSLEIEGQFLAVHLGFAACSGMEWSC